MTILPKEKPKSHKKKQSIETLKKMKDFLEPESFEYIRKDLAKKYEHPAISAVKEAHKIVTEKHKKKIKLPKAKEFSSWIKRKPKEYDSTEATAHMRSKKKFWIKKKNYTNQ